MRGSGYYPEYTDGYNLAKPAPPGLGVRLRAVLKERPLRHSLYLYLVKLDQVAWVLQRLGVAYHRRFAPTFTVGERAYRYSLGGPPSNRGPMAASRRADGGEKWARTDVWSERTVEVPFAQAFLEASPAERILEVGNVLARRLGPRPGYDVVDKYEAGEGIINEDVVSYRPPRPYDRILSVSTIEHVGFDEREKDPTKPQRALLNMQSMLTPGGRMLVTVPVGYNPAIDQILREEAIPFTERHFLKRTSAWNCWVETTLSEALHFPYEGKYVAANAVAFLILDRPGTDGRGMPG